MDYIDIDKDMIPYQFDMQIEGVTYTFAINYNNLHDFFTIDLLLNDEALILGEKIVYGKPLFLDIQHKVDIDIVPFDLSEEEEIITYENLNESVFLYIVGDED